MKRKIYTFLCCVIVCSVFLWSAVLLECENFDDIPLIESKKEEDYILHRNELMPREDIASIVVDGGKIYILYDETGLINVYRTDGTFEYGIQIPTFQNGRSDIAVLGGILYVNSRRADIYVFQDSQLIECIDPTGNYDKYTSVRRLFDGAKNLYDGEYYYQISEKSNDVIREGTNTIVVNLPEKSHRAEQLIITGLLILAISLIGYEKLFHKTD